MWALLKITRARRRRLAYLQVVTSSLSAPSASIAQKCHSSPISLEKRPAECSGRLSRASTWSTAASSFSSLLCATGSKLRGLRSVALLEGNWCNTNDRETPSASDSGKPLDSDLASAIKDETAASATLHTENENLQSERASKQQSLDEATATRKKQLASYTEEDKELLETVGGLNSAITMLKTHHTDFEHTPHVATAVQDVMQATIVHATHIFDRPEVNSRLCTSQTPECEVMLLDERCG